MPDQALRPDLVRNRPAGPGAHLRVKYPCVLAAGQNLGLSTRQTGGFMAGPQTHLAQFIDERPVADA